MKKKIDWHAAGEKGWSYYKGYVKIFKKGINLIANKRDREKKR